MTRFSKLNQDEFRVNVKGGASDIKLGKLYGVSSQTIMRWRNRLGLESSFWESQRFPCGTYASYGRGCRCEECRDANTEKQRVTVRKMREKGLPPGDARHGTDGGYRNWGCRCKPCRRAGAEKNREQWIENHGDTPRVPRWTEREDFIVRVCPPTEAARLTGRTLNAVYQHRQSLGITKQTREKQEA